MPGSRSTFGSSSHAGGSHFSESSRSRSHHSQAPSGFSSAMSRSIAASSGSTVRPSRSHAPPPASYVPSSSHHTSSRATSSRRSSVSSSRHEGSHTSSSRHDPPPSSHYSSSRRSSASTLRPSDSISRVASRAGGGTVVPYQARPPSTGGSLAGAPSRTHASSSRGMEMTRAGGSFLSRAPSSSRRSSFAPSSSSRALSGQPSFDPRLGQALQVAQAIEGATGRQPESMTVKSTYHRDGTQCHHTTLRYEL